MTVNRGSIRFWMCILGISFIYPSSSYIDFCITVIHKAFVPFAIHPVSCWDLTIPPNSANDYQKFEFPAFTHGSSAAILNGLILIFAYTFNPSMLFLVCISTLSQICLEMSFKGLIGTNELIGAFICGKKKFFDIVFRNFVSSLCGFIVHKIITIWHFWHLYLIGALIAFTFIYTVGWIAYIIIYDKQNDSQIDWLIKFWIDTLPIILYYFLFTIVTNITCKIVVLFILDMIRFELCNYSAIATNSGNSRGTTRNMNIALIMIMSD